MLSNMRLNFLIDLIVLQATSPCLWDSYFQEAKDSS